MKISKTDFFNVKDCIVIIHNGLKILVSPKDGLQILGMFYKKSDNILYTSQSIQQDMSSCSFGHDFGIFPEYQDEDISAVFEKGAVVCKKDSTKNAVSLSISSEKSFCGLKKILTFDFSEDNFLQVDYVLGNFTPWKLKTSLRTTSVFNPEGAILVPFNAENSSENGGFSNSFSFEKITALAEQRLMFDSNYFVMRHDSKKEKIVIGSDNKSGWCTYLNSKLVFTKYFQYFYGEKYYNAGATCTYLDSPAAMKLAIDGPEMDLEPGEAACHREYWSITPLKSKMDFNALEHYSQIYENAEDMSSIFYDDEDCDCDDDCDCHHHDDANHA